MNTHADRTQENKNETVANALSRNQTGSESAVAFEDNRPEAAAQRQMQQMVKNRPGAKQAAQLQAKANNYTARQYQPIQKQENNAGAYAQGTDIHLGPGQGKHIPHEAWHVVQQKQGRVKPAMQMNGELIQRRVDPDFVTYHNANGGGAATKPEMQTFYDRFVESEVARLSAKHIDDDVKEKMKSADLYFRLFMANSNQPNEIFRKLNQLVRAVNAACDSLDRIINARGAPADAEQGYRYERERREGAKHFAGTTKEMALRGVASKAEADTILTNLHTQIAGAIGGGFAVGNVGVRGSAVTGVRTRNGAAFEQGVGAYDNASDASDLDFFFTSPTLEAQILATQHHLPADRRINAGGTMNAQYLHRWLNLGAAVNGYAASAALLAALTNFTTNTTNLIGRKSDVTFVGGATAAGLMGDAGTLIR